MQKLENDEHAYMNKGGPVHTQAVDMVNTISLQTDVIQHRINTTQKCEMRKRL